MIHVRLAGVWLAEAAKLRKFLQGRSLIFLIALLFSLIFTVACSQPRPDNTLATVLSRGRVICGVNGQHPGFSFQSPDGDYSGLDADYCRAIASALFDDPGKVEFRRGTHSLSDLTAGKVDILLRDTPWTIERDGAIDFAQPVFYDGQGLLAPTNFSLMNLSPSSLEAFRDKTICVQANTPAEVLLKAFFRRSQIPINAVALDGVNELFINFANGNCEIATANRSELAIRRQTFTYPERYQLLDLTLSQEPLAPMVRSNQSQWLDVVKWVTYGMFRAEELGVSQQNVMMLGSNPDPEIQRFLGAKGAYGSNLNIPNDFMKRVIHHVGNYAEVYQRNIGKPFQLPRGINKLWINGGLICPMPYR
jgi:general L-amino acid transport system substrate-binding protein